MHQVDATVAIAFAADVGNHLHSSRSPASTILQPLLGILFDYPNRCSVEAVPDLLLTSIIDRNSINTFAIFRLLLLAHGSVAAIRGLS